MTQQSNPAPPLNQPPVPQASPPSWRKRHPKLFWTGIIVGVLLVFGIIGSLNSPKPSTSVADGSSTKSAAATVSAGGGGSSTTSAPRATKTSGIGREVRDGKFAFVVHKIKCGVSSVGTQYLGTKAQGQFCLVNLTVKNIGEESQTLLSSNQYAYKGETKYSVDDPATLYAAANGDSPWIKDINPGNSVTGTLVFDIPKGVRLDKLELHDSAFSDGVQVPLT